MVSAWIGAILLLVLGVIATVFASRFVERRTGRFGRPVASIGRSFGYFGCVAIGAALGVATFRDFGPYKYAIAGICAGVGSLIGQAFFGERKQAPVAKGGTQ